MESMARHIPLAPVKGRLLREYITAIRDVVNPELEIGIGEREYYPNQVMKLTADISELTEDTGICTRS